MFMMYGCGRPGALTGCGKRLLLLIRQNGLQLCVRLQFVSNGPGNQSTQPINGCILSVLALLLHLPHYSHYSAACGLSNALSIAYGLAGDQTRFSKGIFINNPVCLPFPWTELIQQQNLRPRRPCGLTPIAIHYSNPFPPAPFTHVELRTMI